MHTRMHTHHFENFRQPVIRKFFLEHSRAAANKQGSRAVINNLIQTRRALTVTVSLTLIHLALYSFTGERSV